jgi:hypothetical protein
VLLAEATQGQTLLVRLLVLVAVVVARQTLPLILLPEVHRTKGVPEAAAVGV